jgi:probable rRNA maturation factor
VQRAARLSGDVNILLTSNAEIQRLNRQFRQKDAPTDVLSFPAEQSDSQPGRRQPVRPRRAPGGDIVISTQTARVQAAEIGHDLSTEVKVLILHGMLHLAGYDHEIDRGQMSRLEQKLRSEFNLPAALIERTVGVGSARS